MMPAKLRPQLLPAIASHMLRGDGPDHVRLRRLVSAAFTRRPMEALDGRIAELTGDLLGEPAAGHGPQDVVDLHEEFAHPLPMTVICELLGVPEEHRAPFRDLTMTIAAGFSWPSRPSPRPPTAWWTCFGRWWSSNAPSPPRTR
jgi:cytochrome P450